MRKRYRVPLLAALVAALVVPVGFALSIESKVSLAQTAAAPMVATTLLSPVPDGAKLLVVGTILIGLAAFVRKAV
jgi:hypothetical protein